MQKFERITSTQNPIVRRFRRAAAGEERDRMVADGVRLVAAALAAGREVLEVAISPKLDAGGGAGALRERLDGTGVAAHRCSDAVLGRISNLVTPQGVVAIVRRPRWTVEDLVAGDGLALVVVAAGVRDPGNLGALLRAAEAAGATGLAAVDSADPFRDKAVRGSAGSVFRLPALVLEPDAVLAELVDRHGLRLVIAEGSAEREYLQADLRAPCAVAVGAEGSGVPDWLRACADERVRIPMAGGVESLNVTAAAAVLLYEARRQRS